MQRFVQSQRARLVSAEPSRGALACAFTGAFALAMTATLAQAQDLQPGRNFLSVAAFGTNRSADIDAGDVDNDGDLDVLVGNGMDGDVQLNRIYINQGGLQAGVQGSFVEETAARFVGAIAERTRDIAFVDLDADGDLDVMDVTDGTNTAGGGVQRLYTNQGGAQLGSVGFYLESSDTSWGTLVSIPLPLQELGGNQGPWRGPGWDADFGDLDLDGDLDLFWSTHGLFLNGTTDSRVFLNDGSGVLNELWPWANPGADTKMHSADSALADLDGDFDLDIVCASTASQSRVFSNNLNGRLGPAPFQDVTGSALVATGSTQSGGNCYEVEFFDADGDGDFDLWATSYANTLDRVLRNDSLPPGAPGAGVFFKSQTTWIQGDPNADEQGGDPIDYDGDGDLDFMMANFAGTNALHRNTLAQGGLPTVGFRRTGVVSLSEAPEAPALNNGGTTLDVEAVDLDGDGDDDLCVGNDANEQNFLFTNTLGVPDVHAPTFAAVEAVSDRALGDPARVIAQIRDNHPIYALSRSKTRLVWSVDVGAETTVDMLAQGGAQFMGAIPGHVPGLIAYRIECTDAQGNVGISSTQTYTQGIPNVWSDLGLGLAGVQGVPQLAGIGSLTPGSAGALQLTAAATNATGILFLGFGAGAVPFKLGTLVPTPVSFQYQVFTNLNGAWSGSWTSWPVGFPSGTTLVLQAWITDAAAPAGVSASNAISGLVP